PTVVEYASKLIDAIAGNLACPFPVVWKQVQAAQCTASPGIHHLCRYLAIVSAPMPHVGDTLATSTRYIMQAQQQRLFVPHPGISTRALHNQSASRGVVTPTAPGPA